MNLSANQSRRIKELVFGLKVDLEDVLLAFSGPDNDRLLLEELTDRAASSVIRVLTSIPITTDDALERIRADFAEVISAEPESEALSSIPKLKKAESAVDYINRVLGLEAEPQTCPRCVGTGHIEAKITKGDTIRAVLGLQPNSGVSALSLRTLANPRLELLQYLAGYFADDLNLAAAFAQKVAAVFEAEREAA